MIVATISLAVSFLALLIGTFTYFSIDEVNAISRMDGNVMENPRYYPNLLRYFLRFPQVTLQDASSAMMNHMQSLFSKKIKSGARLADNVQEIADILVLVPFLIKSNEPEASAIQRQRVSRLLRKIKTQVNEFESISDGSCKLLKETTLLIEAVYEQQCKEHADGGDPSMLLKIRGDMFINPASSLLYYNYLGLYFLHLAVTNINQGDKTPSSLRQQIDGIRHCHPDKLSMARVYAAKASEAFQRANENVGDDMMWNACTNFNIARAEYLILQIAKVTGEDFTNIWEKYADKSIREWIILNKIIADHMVPNKERSWFQQALISQENKMRLKKVIYQIMNGQVLTDFNGNAIGDKYEDFLNTSFFQSLPKEDPQARTDELVQDILDLIK